MACKVSYPFCFGNSSKPYCHVWRDLSYAEWQAAGSPKHYIRERWLDDSGKVHYQVGRLYFNNTLEYRDHELPGFTTQWREALRHSL